MQKFEELKGRLEANEHSSDLNSKKIDTLSHKVDSLENELVKTRNELFECNKLAKTLAIEHDNLLSEYNLELSKSAIPNLTDASFKSYVDFIVEQAKNRDIDFFSVFCNNLFIDSREGFYIRCEEDLNLLYNLYIKNNTTMQGYEYKGEFFEFDTILNKYNIKSKRHKRLILRTVIYDAIVKIYLKSNDENTLFDYLVEISTGGYLSLRTDDLVVKESAPEARNSKQYLVYSNNNMSIYAGEPYDVGMRFFSCFLGNCDIYSLLKDVKFCFLELNSKLSKMHVDCMDGGLVYESK